MRDPYPGNIIPANDPLRSQVAAKIVALMVRPDRAGLSNNVAGNPAGDQTWELDARNILRRARPHLLAEVQGELQLLLEQPARRSGTAARSAGCTTEFDGELEPEKNDDYFGDGLLPAHLHASRPQQFDWVIKQQPAEPLHRRLGPLVHGGQLASPRARAGRRSCGAPEQGGLLDRRGARPS